MRGPQANFTFSPRLSNSLEAILKNILAALQREWGTSDQPLKMLTVNDNKYSSAA
jgi:hypothetical protein